MNYLAATINFVKLQGVTNTQCNAASCRELALPARRLFYPPFPWRICPPSFLSAVSLADLTALYGGAAG